MDAHISGLLESIYGGRTQANELEDDSIDFKREAQSVSETQHLLAEAAVCFANASGGTLIVGVDDRTSGPGAVIGTELDSGALRRRIHQVTEPALDVTMDALSFHGVRLVQVTVQEGLDIHAARGRIPTRRFQDQCLPMSSSDIGRIHDERRGTDWSSADTGRLFSEVDPAALAQARSLLRQVPADTMRSVSEGNDRDLLSALGVLTDTSTLNRAGELLFCREHDGMVRETLVYQHRETMGGEVDGGRRWSGPLLIATVEALNYIEARLGTTPINLSSGQQLQIQDYPLVAVREAIANAMMHGDHRDHRPVHVEHSPEALEVGSPGPLVTGISPANILTHPPKSRFPALADAMRTLGLAERWGQGVDRMYREMIRAGKTAPTVVVREGDEPETVVRFLGGPPNARIAKFISGLPNQEQNDTDALIIVSVLASKRTVNAAGVSSLVQRDAADAQAVLHRLATGEAQLIEPTPRTVGRARPDYRLRSDAIVALGPALACSARPTIDRDRKIYDHIGEYGSINNGTIQRLFDLDVYLARNVLQELVGREVLVRTSEQKRGTAVRYGPGPKFPPANKRSRSTSASSGE